MEMSQRAMPMYVCVHVPEFPLQALLRLRPALEGKPVVVLAGDPPLQKVCSASAEAFRLGVCDGMTKAELESFPGVGALQRSTAEERSAQATLLEAASAFTPRMEVQAKRGSALDVVLDMTGTSRLFGPIQDAVKSLERSLRSLCFAARFAASANLQAAVCLAATARKQPIFVVPGKEAEALRALPLRSLALTTEQAATLDLWGLHTLGELAGLPEAELVVRLGQEGKQLRLLARGEYPHLMVPEEPALSLAEYIAFDAPMELLESLLFVLGPMLDQLLARARNHALALASVSVTLGLEGGAAHQRMIKPALPVAQRDVLLKLLHLDLQAHPPSAGVMTVSLQAEPGDRSKVQLGLFAPQTPEPMRLDVTLARIAALVGEGRLGRARLLDAHTADSFVMERFTIADAGTAAKNKETTPRHAPEMVLRRFRPALRLAVKLQASQPAAFWLEGREYAVRQAFGPWRKSGAWWSAVVWSMEEWDVCAGSAAGDTLLCVLAHDLLHHHWQMDALYD
jgi:protein ImuB